MELAFICAALAVVVGSLVFVAVGSMQMLSAARGYSQGEALWSKGQKDAILDLRCYAQTRSEADYERFLAAIRVPLACRAVRQEMDRARYDPAVLAGYFAEVGIHEDDRRRMIWLYRNFKRESHLAQAISIWRGAEPDLDALLRNGERLHRNIVAGSADPAFTAEALLENDAINRKLTPLEADFSQSLAAAGRWLHACLIWTVSVLGLVLVVAGSAAYYRLFSRIANSEHKYRHLIDTASEAIVIADERTGVIVDANRKALDLLGFPIPVETILSLLGQPSSGANRERPRFSEIVNVTREAQLRASNGAHMDVEFSGSVVTLDRRNLVELIVRDVTEQRRAAQMLRESEQRYRQLSDDLIAARDRALDASRAKSQFLANMSHEIRTPLNGVMGMIGLALERCSDEEQQEQLSMAQGAAKTLVGIINDVLDFSRIEAGKMTLESIDFGLREACEETLRIFQTAVRNKRIGLELNFAETCPAWVRGDPIRLRQILLNLIGNAVKFTERGGVQVLVTKQADLVQIEVRDTGIGIPAGKLDAIFDAFTQADGSHARQFGGSGLGLTITRRLVELMGGHVRVDSVEERGSSFFVELPFTAVAPQPAKRPFSAAPHRLPPLRILVAEDNLVNQKVIGGVLGRLGCIVTVAGNGREAFQRFLETDFDLILMDVQMPEVDGFEATRLIREREASRPDAQRMPILAVTAHASRQLLDQCIETGMDGAVTKPLDTAELIEKMLAVAPSRRLIPT